MANGGFDTSRHERLRDPERLERLRIPEVLDRLLDADVRHVIDVGAGTGVWAEAFLKAGVLEVTAVDSSSIMIEQLARLLPEVKHMQTEATDIRLPDEAADLVFSAFVLHEIEDKVAALAEWKRLSRRKVAVMDWRYVEQTEGGPPTSHRVKREEAVEYGRQVGLDDPDIWETEEWMLYTWDIPHPAEQ